MDLPALTLTQPDATLVALGRKRIETRSWATRHRGRIGVHAAHGLGPVGERRELAALCWRPGMAWAASCLPTHCREV